LSDQLELRAQDRVLVIAPHPDDESIATGGLLQLARGAGAAIRLVVLTDGDNNPWPQRWIEKRWRIDAPARARWGARRREEARAAMRVLGIAEDEARFLGLPDLGLTDLLMRADRAVTASLSAIFAEFVPTHLVFPALSDRHPDHSAAHVLVRIALEHNRQMPRLLTFGVHGIAKTQGEALAVLDEKRRNTKRSAILAHATQMRFSSGRFLAFASENEMYLPATTPAAPDATHPLTLSVTADGNVVVRIDRQRWGAPLRGQAVFVALEGEASVRTVMAVEGTGNAGEALSMALPGVAGLRQGYAKLARREPGWRVFDRFGWQSIAS
jgi:LmbE family N-acetylglucosaminyl deacetylase